MDNKAYNLSWEITQDGHAKIHIKKEFTFDDCTYVMYYNGFLFDWRLMRALRKAKKKCEKLNKRREKILALRNRYTEPPAPVDTTTLVVRSKPKKKR
jgi:hypothetical protein